jgi:uncharacterized membrane protein
MTPLSEQYKALATTTVYVIDAAGVLVIVAGILIAAGLAVKVCRATGVSTAYHTFRRILGRSILLALEFFIAGDIIRTVLVSHSVSSVTVLALIVLIRTFLSMALQVEVEGHWPWQQPHATKE